MDVNDRAIDLLWGSVTGTLCLLLAVRLLSWHLWSPAVSLFGPRIDPSRRLQFAYGIFAMAMAFTNYLCRFIPHAHFAYTHEAFAMLTLILIGGLGPRIFMIARERVIPGSL